MTTRPGRLLLALCLFAAGCVVPSLEDLEAERERTCDVDHLCLSDYLCVSGVCKKSGNLDCTPQATQPCGMATGECVQGTETCGADGKWGTCVGEVGSVAEVCDGKDNDCDGTPDEGLVTPSCGVDAGVCAGKNKVCNSSGMLESPCGAASYGTNWQASESRCDGLDNDCDGQTDENLAAVPCDKDAGVCVGATRACLDGQLPTCSDSTYAAHSSFYESLESSCDGKDNDCDGFTDSWAARQVSDGGAGVYRRVAAVVMPGTGTALRRDVLTLYEESGKVVAKVLAATGATSTPRAPATTGGRNQAAPAIGTNGVDVAEAWVDELVAGPTTNYRLLVGLAGPLGEAITNGLPGVSPLQIPGPGQKVQVGMTAGRIILVYSHLDTPTSGTTSVTVASCPKSLAQACTTLSLGGGRNPTLMVESDTALVVYERGSQLSLAKLAVPSAGTVTRASDLAFGSSGEHDPALSGTLAGLQVYSVVPGAPDTMTRRTGSCSAGCDPSTFTATANFFTFLGSASALTSVGSASTRVLTWEDTQSARRVVRMLLPGQTVATEVSPSGATGRRPVTMLSGTDGFEVLWDAESGTGAGANQVLSRRFCGP